MRRNGHGWERPETKRRLWVGYALVLTLLIGVELFVHHHQHFGIEASFGFYAWFGFVVSVALVGIARLLEHFLKRKDTYYDD